jgi:hypothetical protein
MQNLEVSPRVTYKCDRYPDECPRCHKHVHASLKLAQLLGETGKYNDRATIEAVFLCPVDDCKRYFIAYFRETDGGNRYGGGEFRFTGAAPWVPVAPMVFEGIRKLSPNFYEIYAQAAEADVRKLDQVAGVGYRKALEFLIKDYCSSKRPEDEGRIKATNLGPCIDTFVSDQNIKDCAKLATWLGNDETHYVRKWDNKDIHDLKSLISLTSSWIETSIKTDQYRASMLSKSA